MITGNRGTTDPLAFTEMLFFQNLARRLSLNAQHPQYQLKVSKEKVRRDGPEEHQRNLRMTEERFQIDRVSPHLPPRSHDPKTLSSKQNSADHISHDPEMETEAGM